TRPGAVACISIVVTHFTVDDDLVVKAGDTLFYDDFDLNEIINKFRVFQRLDAEASLVQYVSCKDKVSLLLHSVTTFSATATPVPS
ncbi:hypothetical protein LSAT2_012173, partial [Lamellibrachia satsuma]